MTMTSVHGEFREQSGNLDNELSPSVAAAGLAERSGRRRT